MAKSSKNHITIGAIERESLKEWVNGSYHLQWTRRDDKELIEKLISSRRITKTDVRKAVAAMRRTRAEGNRRIREYGQIPRDKVALATLDEQIEDVAIYAA